MKKRFFFLGLIFALSALAGHAQIDVIYTQDFETGTPQTYTTSGNVGISTTIASGGSRAAQIHSITNQQEWILLDTIDFSQNSDYHYYTLEFMQIAFIDPRDMASALRMSVCNVEARLPTSSAWITLSGTHYNMADGGCRNFSTYGCFHKDCYSDWTGTTASNAMWKKERFDLNSFFNGVAPQDKKLLVRFKVWERQSATDNNAGWFLDDITFRASSQAIVTPYVTMLSFPDYINYPSSRGALLKALVTTPVVQGINGDSVYAEYRVGNNPTLHRAYLHRSGPNGLFEGRIPFYGFDTLMHYHLIIRDSTVNDNTVTFPKNSSQWLTYRCKRGKTNTAGPPGNQSNNSNFPFPYYADNKSEFIYDSVFMAEMGYGPGYIKSFRFIISNNNTTIVRPRLQIRMCNKSYSENRTGSNLAFTATAMPIVYDSVFVLEQCAANSYKTITLQDTFFYSGSDLVVQMILDGGLVDPVGTPIKHIPAPSNKQSLMIVGHEGSLEEDVFNGEASATGIVAQQRPWIQFYESKHLPLMSDCGISALAYPSYDVPCNHGTDSVVVWLKNFGVHTMNAVRIWYRIDNEPPVYYDWTGTLAGGDSVRVHLNNNQTFVVGYHTMRAWVDDTITEGTLRVRDHEPYNDTSFAPFAVCDGPYSGVRTIGTGASANFSSLENCLYVLSRCGVNGPLTIKMPAGNYGIVKFPFIPGASETNMITFEPATESSVVTFRRPRQGESTNAEYLVDISEARGILFRNINFCNGRFSDNRCNVLVQMGEGSNLCVFENCYFADSNTINSSCSALLKVSEADSVLVTNCVFYGGAIGVDVRGSAPDDLASNNTVQFCEFSNQVNTAISVVNQSNVVVDSNMVYDVRTNASYTVLGQYVYDASKITRNKVYSTKGSSCIGVSDMHGNSQTYGVVANNMIVSLFDGSTNMLTTPLNIIKGSYLKVVFNSVRMNAPDFVNVAAATLGGDIVSNIYFQNNVIASFDTSNYAFNFMPGSNMSNLHVDHNCYYSCSGVLNKLTGINYYSMNNWRTAVPGDQGSVTGNPNYTNGSTVDLRSFSELLRNVGTPVPGVTIDMFGTTRNATAPSLGAYEVSVLAVDFTPVEFVTPLPDYCGAPASIPVEVAIRNTGNGTYTYSTETPITVYYSLNGGPVQTFTVSRNCGPSDTIHFLSTRTMSLPSGPNNSDETYSIRWWVKCSLDPDDMNDTSMYTVISRYAAPAPTVINQNVPYRNFATITPSSGINSWPVNYYTSGNGRMQNSGISWFHSLDDTNYFFYGPTLVTSPLYADTTFYISQKRNLPLVKITEVQVSRAPTAVGVTYPMPSWMHAQTNIAIELTNCGDYPANLEGDSIIIVQATSAAKIWVLPNVTIQPGANLVLQFKTSATASDSTRTIFAPSTAIPSVSYTANFGVIYRDGNGVADAVPFNSVITTASTQPINWSNQSIPASVWQGSAINLAQGASTATPPVNTQTAGARRVAWPTNAPNASPTATATLWQVATNANPMHIGETESELIRYFDNGCEGARAAVNLHVTNIPNIDITVEDLQVNEGCSLTEIEPVSVDVHNYGSQAVSSVVVKYSLDGGTTVACADTLSVGIPARGMVHHTFTNTINMHTMQDSTFHLMVWVDLNDSDPYHDNDTLRGEFLALYTPEMPIVVSPQTINYNSTATLVASGLNNRTATAWYSSTHTLLGITMGSYVTPIIYHPDTFYVSGVALVNMPNTHIGTLASVTNNNFPSPYNPKTRYVKEQYLIPAEQMIAAGHGAGDIGSVAFYLESLGNNVSTFQFDYYTIKMGTVPEVTFTNGDFKTGLTQVYSASNLSFSAQNIGWVTHTLDTVFHWDGESSIVIEVTRGLSTAGISGGANTRYTAQPNTVITKQNNTADQSTQTSGSRGGNRPDITFGFWESVGCIGPEAMIRIEVDGVPDTDAAVSWPSSLDTLMMSSCDTISLNVKIDNHGQSNINNYTLHYKIDNGAWQQTTGSANNLPLGYSREVHLLNTLLSPGRHVITAVIDIPGDSVTTNDTIRRTINVRFCTGNYIVGSCAGSEYPTIIAAIDTLTHAGVVGAVTFDLCADVFEGQLNIGPIDGVNDTNTITFRTIPGASMQAQVIHTPTNASNHVIRIFDVSNIRFDNIYFYANYTTGTGNNIFANVAKIDECSNIRFSNCTLRSKKTAASTTNASLVLLGNGNHFITIDSCLLDSGYYAVRSVNNEYSDNITIKENTILNFWYQGIHIRNTDTLSIYHDTIFAASSLAGKPLTGIYVANGMHVGVQRNSIYLLDTRTGGKRGIAINNCRGTNIDRVTVYNNMISLSGTGVASLASSGIWVDSLCKHVNVYFNTASLYAGPSQPQTRTFSCQNSSSVHVLNNIFDNRSKGYAYYVAIDTCVVNSNFNVYYSNSEPNPNTGARSFAFWSGQSPVCLDSLKYINNKDNNSKEEYPFFFSETDLHLTLAQFAGDAQYNPDVTTDVFGKIRPQIPAPTIGAYEFHRLAHNIAIAVITEPYVPLITTGANPDVQNIETDSIRVRIKVYNNGDAPENNVTWYAYMADVFPQPRSETRTISRLPLRTLVEDSTLVPSPLGIVDTQKIVVVLNIGPGVTDNDLSNNVDTAEVFLYPAYDLQLVSIALDSTVDPLHCRMYQVPLKYTLRNVGKKDFPGDVMFTLGYDYYAQQSGSNPLPNFPNIPGANSDDLRSLGTALPVGTMTEMVNSPSVQPNLYPTGYIGDLTIKLRGFVHYEHDVKPLTDTTNYINITSNHTPEMPIPHDTMVDYGTYANFWATQNAGRTIRWHRDTVSGNFFYNGNNNYGRSTHWSNTPQYFHDSLYYLSCLSTRNCTSYYSSINVGINPPLYYDVSISEVRSPRASGRVYLEKDTVTLRVVNYGSEPISNIPIAFKFMNANGRVTYLEVHDTVRATIPGRIGDNVSYYDFSFDTALLQINQPLSNTNFTLNAWVYHPDDQQRGNDTLRTLHNFCSLAENIYDTINSSAPTSVEGFDITRVSYNELDNIMPDMIGYDNLWLGNYNPSQAEIPTLYIRRGTQDTLTIEVANNLVEFDSSTAASLCVAIDYNRDGSYDFNGVENLTKSLLAKNAKVRSRREYKLPLTIPEYAHYGYMRMLVWVDGDSTAYVNGIHTLNVHGNGQMQQYLLYIQEDVELDSVDAALTRVVAPRNHIVTDTDHYVSIMLANKGATPITNATISYNFSDNFHPQQSGVINWMGNLEPGMSAVVRLDSVYFYEGTTDLVCNVEVEGDTFHTTNNTLHYRYHRYFVIQARYIDSFDQELNRWYVPAGYNNFTRNYFDRGTPAKTNIVSSYSQPNAYVTSCTEPVISGKHGNRSVLYSPIINLRRIRIDTVEFLLSKNMGEGSFLKLEYINFEHKWVTLDDDAARWTADPEDNPSWYDQKEGWTGNTRNGEYIHLSLATKPLTGDFAQELQFRFVYTTPVTTSPAANFGDGAAIDNFIIGRQQRDIDVGVTEITHPVDPQFGQTIYPRVIIHNYGYDSISNFRVSYIPYGSYLAHEAMCEYGISPGGDIEYEFPFPFTITNDYPDTFSIAAFTDVQLDLYKDNDTTVKVFGLAPLANDLYLYALLSPLESAVAGDSLNITLRLRNFGQNEIEDCDVFYIYNEGDTVCEHIHFPDYLGHNLPSTEYFNYTFRKRERATMGTMLLTTWCKYNLDVYPYNDTIVKEIAGIAAITDARATAAIIDERNSSKTQFGVIIDNVGANVINDFPVGFFIDKDPAKGTVETFHRAEGIPAGGRAIYYFKNYTDPGRTAPYEFMTAYVTVPGDTHKVNDTTDVVIPTYTDILAVKLQIEENRTDSCRVRAVVYNNGTVPYFNIITLTAFVNGVRFTYGVPREGWYIEPGEYKHIDFLNKQGGIFKIAKAPDRKYVGELSFTTPTTDSDPSNNQTTIIEVLNYFEDIPFVAEPGFALEQNYPNPYDGTTRIEFVLPTEGRARFFVNDLVGRQIHESTSYYTEGRHVVSFDGSNLPSGVYYYGIEFNGERRMRKMIIK